MSQGNLKERLGAAPIRPLLIRDCVDLIDTQVKGKTGLSGIAIKGAYKTIKAVKKGFITEVVDNLLDDWLEQLQPHHDTWVAENSGTFANFLATRTDAVADDLLKVTDIRAESTRHTTAKKAYQKMRGSAKANVVQAVPDLGRVVEKHLS